MFDPIVPTDRCVSLADRPSAAPSDDRLLQAVARRRDQNAFEALYHRHVCAVTAVALHVTRDRWAAEEIAQQTFAALWERADRLAAKALRVRPWLTTVARNAAIDRLRAAEETLPLDETIAPPVADGDPAAAAIAAGDRAALHAAIAMLPADQRAVIELVGLGGRTCGEAAERLGAPLGTVKSRLRLALKHLRVALTA